MCVRSVVLLSFLTLFATAAGPAPAPVYVGGMAHGARNIRILADLKLGNFIWIPPTYYWESGNVPWDEDNSLEADVRACVENGFAFMVGQRRGLGDTVRHGGFEYGGHGSGETHPEAAVRKVIDIAGDRFLGLHAEELDADFLQDAIRELYRFRNPELYRFTDRAGGRRAFEGELRRLQERYRNWGAPFLPNLCVTYHHSGFRIGADRVLAELLEHLPAAELQLAYLRGGSRQFGGRWGAWVSPWYYGSIPCEDPEYWGTKRAQPGGGHDASALRRCLILAYASGASLLTAQETEPLFARDGDGFRLTAWGSELKRIHEVASDNPLPVVPEVPTALLTDADAGWAPAFLWQNWVEEETVWGKLPTQREDAMLAACLDALLPGFGRTPQAVRERRDRYPGNLAATPAGPFDILSSDLPDGIPEGYRTVIVAGRPDLTPRLRAQLRRFVAAGGFLLLNALQMQTGGTLLQESELLGCTVDLGGTYSRLSAAAEIRVAEGREAPLSGTFAEPWFCVAPVTVSNAEVLAATPDGLPVLLRNRFGRGTVYLTTPEFMLGGYGSRREPLNFGRALVSALAGKEPLCRSASRDLSYVRARQGRDALVAVANHGPAVAEVALEAGPGFARWRVEAGGEGGVAREGVGTDPVILRVAGNDAVLIRFSP